MEQLEIKDYLKETLESMFDQTYNDYEIVIVDDGSLVLFA
jgi:glycosyltransferase involved in cell wall biosynthesis